MILSINKIHNDILYTFKKSYIYLATTAISKFFHYWVNIRFKNIIQLKRNPSKNINTVASFPGISNFSIINLMENTALIVKVDNASQINMKDTSKLIFS